MIQGWFSRDGSPYGRDSIADATCLMGWLSVAFGIAILVGGNSRTNDVLDDFAPLWAWVAAFWTLGISTFFGAMFGTFQQRLWLAVVTTFSWATVIGVYVVSALDTGRMFPTGIFATVLFCYSIFSVVKLWTWTRGK